MNITQKLVATGAALLCATLLAACGNDNHDASSGANTEPAARVQLHGAGSTFVAPLMARWIKAYRGERPGVEVVYDAVGSGEGIERFIAGGVDFGASDAAMNNKEIARVQPPAGRGVKLIPVTAGEVVIAYNIPGLRGDLRLPREVYAGIFLGTITHWNDPRISTANPGLALPAKRIQVVARRDSSGTTYAFTNHLSAVSEAWRNGPGTAKLVDWPGSAMIALGNEGVAQRLKITSNSIGYVEYGFARRLGLRMAMLENRAGRFVAPGAAGGKAALDAAAQEIPDDLRLFLPDPPGAGAYPMVSLVWVLLHDSYPDPARADALVRMLDWGLGQMGQFLAEEAGYIPLSDNLLVRARRAIHETD
jgi:phosphate transport system substrate-binding protein